MKYLIYKITNKINNKCYIGKTNNLKSRIAQHKKYDNSSYIHKSIKKHGFENFTVEVLQDNIIDEDQAYKLEAEYIKFHNSTDSKIGYNLTAGGRGVMSNVTHTKKGRQKISDAQKGMPARRENYDVSTETRDKLSTISKENKGKLSLEIQQEILEMYNSCQYTKQQIADIFGIRYEAVRFITIYYKKYGFRTEEEMTANRIKGHAGAKGVPLSDEHKAKVSEALKGHSVSEETCANISKALTGKVLSKETRNKIAVTLSGDSDYIEKRDKIVSLYKGGMKKKQIAVELGLSASVVHAACFWCGRQK